MDEVKIIIGEDEFKVNFEFLISFTKSLPEEEKYSKLAARITALNIPSLTAALLEKDGLLTTESLDALWDMNDLNIQRSLVSNSQFMAYITNDQARRIMELDDGYIWNALAQNAEYLLDEIPFLETRIRLSEEMAMRLYESLRKLSVGLVQDTLDFNYQIPKKYWRPLSEYIKAGCRPQSMNVECADMDTVAALPDAAYRYLYVFAQSLQDIKDERAKKGVALFLLSQPDPYLRLELAENSSVPAWILERLISDEEPEVREAARKSLLKQQKPE